MQIKPSANAKMLLCMGVDLPVSAYPAKLYLHTDRTIMGEGARSAIFSGLIFDLEEGVFFALWI